MPFVKTGSPALNAGNTAFSSTIGASYTAGACFALPTGLGEYWKDIIVDVYPNPSSGLFTTELAEPSLLSIYTITGTKVLDRLMIPSKKLVDLTEQPTGIYIGVFEGKSGVATISSLNFNRIANRSNDLCF